MKLTLMDILFDCWHSNFTRPMTTKEKGCYVVCLECGEEFRYDFRLMKVSHKLPRIITHYPDSHEGRTLDELTEQVERTR